MALLLTPLAYGLRTDWWFAAGLRYLCLLYKLWDCSTLHSSTGADVAPPPLPCLYLQGCLAVLDGQGFYACVLLKVRVTTRVLRVVACGCVCVCAGDTVDLSGVLGDDVLNVMSCVDLVNRLHTSQPSPSSALLLRRNGVHVHDMRAGVVCQDDACPCCAERRAVGAKSGSSSCRGRSSYVCAHRDLGSLGCVDRHVSPSPPGSESAEIRRFFDGRIVRRHSLCHVQFREGLHVRRRGLPQRRNTLQHIDSM
eukprot:704846-Rhodomonas_salina.3